MLGILPRQGRLRSWLKLVFQHLHSAIPVVGEFLG